MHLTPLDWTVIGVSVVVSFLPAIFFAKRAGKSTAEFFTSGRAAPWWLVGVSMVATTFSTDTPNLVTNMVRENGVSDNWLKPTTAARTAVRRGLLFPVFMVPPGRGLGSLGGRRRAPAVPGCEGSHRT